VSTTSKDTNNTVNVHFDALLTQHTSCLTVSFSQCEHTMIIDGLTLGIKARAMLAADHVAAFGIIYKALL